MNFWDTFDIPCSKFWNRVNETVAKFIGGKDGGVG
jgi:hypothetical protein